MIASAYEALFTAALCVLGALVLFCLARAVRGPRISDRLVAVNMISTLVIVIIGILAVMLREGYLMDVALIYAMISFLAVVVLCKVYMGVHFKREEAREKEDGGDA